MTNIIFAISGANTMGFLVAALLMFRAYGRTRDQLFSAFGMFFLLMGIGQLLSWTGPAATDQDAWVFLPRLAAFMLIIYSLVIKNFMQRKAK